MKSRMSAPTMDITNPAGCSALCQIGFQIRLLMNPPIKDPATPTMAVISQPMCPAPGMRKRAMTPTINPTISIQRIRINPITMLRSACETVMGDHLIASSTLEGKHTTLQSGDISRRRVAAVVGAYWQRRESGRLLASRLTLLALICLVRPFQLHRVAAELLRLPRADVANLAVDVVVPTLARDRISDGLA
jgi:hypothetical protein